MTTPSPKPTCPTCGRMPSERFGEDFAKCEYPGDGETHGPMVEYVPTGYVTARCPDPIHDLADRLVAEHATPRASEADALRAALEPHVVAIEAWAERPVEAFTHHKPLCGHELSGCDCAAIRAGQALEGVARQIRAALAARAQEATE